MTTHSFFAKHITVPAVGLLTVILLVIALKPVQADDSLTISAAIHDVLARHPQITQATEAVASVQSRMAAIRSPFYPTVNGAVSCGLWGPNDPLSFPGLGNFYMAPTAMYDAHIDMNYTIYDFGKRKLSVEAGLLSQATAQEKLRATQQALSYQVIQIFHTIILLDKSIMVKDEERASLDRHLAFVKKKAETGTATDFDVLKTQIQIVTCKTQRIDLVNDRAKKQMLLKQLLGITGTQPLALKGSIERGNELPSSDSLVKYAFYNRSEIIQLHHSQEQAELQLKIAEKENLPSLGFKALAGFKNGIIPDIKTIRFNWSTGAQLSIPIYDGNREKSHKTEAEHALSAVAADILATQERIQTEVLQALSDVTAANDKIDLSASQEELAGQCLTIARAKYDAGVITNVDLLDAERDYAQAKIAHLQNQYVYTLNAYLLEQTIGMSAQN